jgi:hypothetical protein
VGLGARRAFIAHAPGCPTRHGKHARPSPSPPAPALRSYAAYYLTRNSLTYTAPVMVSDPSLGFSMTQIGAMTSIFPIAYGASKFVSGIIGDR